jgi:hypothetical protein
MRFGRGRVKMQAIRKIMDRDTFATFEVPKEFGDKFEMIILPVEDDAMSKNKNIERQKWMKHQEENGFSRHVLAQESEDVWNDI